MSQGSSDLFRPEALKHAAAGDRVEGDVLRISPAWTRWTYWILVGAFVTAIAFGIFGRVNEYASGPAVVRALGRDEITAPFAGTVRSIDARPGDRVDAGQILVRFYAAKEGAELEKLEREFDLLLVRTLRDPADQSARQSLAALQAQKELAAARLEELSIRASRPGLVGDVRIRPGQLLAPGDIVITLLPEQPKFLLVAMLPGSYRPQLRAGMSMRFEVAGYRYAYQEVVIEKVGAQIIGPNEVKRYLGQELGDTVRVDGPVVLVEATPSSSFLVDGRLFDFHHGMSGFAEARVRSERIFIALIPGLRLVSERLGE